MSAPIELGVIASDARKLHERLKGSNHFSPFERQLMAQLFAMNANEEALEDWLPAVADLLEAHETEKTALRERIAELEAENGELRIENRRTEEPRALTAVESITGYARAVDTA